MEDRLIAAPALRVQVYERLRDAILTGELAPGERLSPAQLARRFDVSTMPVRDALQLLRDLIIESGETEQPVPAVKRGGILRTTESGQTGRRRVDV